MAIFQKTEPGLLYELSPGRDGRLLVWSPGLMKYKDCTSLADMSNVNSNYLEQDIDDGCWFYQLPRLENGDNMFYNDTMTELYEGRVSLWHFEANLQSLQSGVNMFKGCSLDAVSVKRIADTLPNTSTGTITLGIHCSLSADSSVVASLAKIESKGWAVETEYNLLYGFTELEYLASTGTQAIDTGILAGDTIGMKVYAQASRNHDGFVGALYEPYMLIRITGSMNCFFRFGTIQWTWIDHPNEQVPFVTSMNFLNERMAWAESQYKYYYWPFRDGKYEAAADNLYLFGMNGTTNYAWNGKIFWAKMSNGENIVRDLIPVLDANGTPCMYDKISRQCFYNVRTGDFIVGMTMKQLPALPNLPTVTSGELKLSLPWEAQLIKYGAPAILEEVKNKGWTLVVQYAEPDTESAVYNKYANCKNATDLAAVNPEFYLDTTSDGEWVYPLPNVTTLGTGWTSDVFGIKSTVKVFRIPLPEVELMFQTFYANERMEHCEIIAPKCKELNHTLRWVGPYTLTYFKCYAPHATIVNGLVTYTRVLEEVELETPMVTNANSYFYRNYGLKRIKCSEDMFHNVTSATDMYVDCYVLELFPVEYPALSTAGGMFSNCKITGQQAIAVLNSIPAYTSGSHPITMGIHVDYENDPDVIAAITNAEAKGWTLTVQWNGTATAAAASTYGLRRPPVYAKLAEPREEEEQMLDWGHYVTNWEENGYTEFASLEEAYAHFGITQQSEEGEVIEA